jgi:hypothetical protein
MQVLGNELNLSWDAVSDAISYQIYASDDPFTSDWGAEIITVSDTTWSVAISENKKFYRIVASTETLKAKDVFREKAPLSPNKTIHKRTSKK